MMNDLQPIYWIEYDDTPLVIAGPCSAESKEQVLCTALQLAAIGIPVFRAGVWKPRTKPGSFEGVGEKALPWMQEVKHATGMLTALEVGTARHVEVALAHDIDILWIGARTSANPFAVQEIADAIKNSGKDIAVLVKNPVNPDLELWIGALERIYNAGVRRLAAVHRGFSAYGKHLYRNMPEWRIPIELRHRLPGLPIICDPSHIGGKRELIAPIAQHALSMGFDGLIIESHCAPEEALSDKEQQVTPAALGEILHSLVRHDTPLPAENIALLRSEIDALDNDLLEVLAKRMRVSRDIGRFKKENRMPILQLDRYDSIVSTRVKQAEQLGLNAKFVRSILSSIHEESVRQQLDDC